MSTKEEKAYMADVAALGCLLCKLQGHDDTPAAVHHQRTGIGMGRRASDFQTIPLCPEHHQGKTGIHGLGRKAFEALYGYSEVALVVMTRELVERLRRRRIGGNGTWQLSNAN